jgi:hypothetical protein
MKSPTTINTKVSDEMMRWYARGSRPERNLQAALVSGLWCYVEALVKGKPRPGLYAMTGAAASAIAMNEHRTRDRAQANERNIKLAIMTADAANGLLDVSPPRKLGPRR